LLDADTAAFAHGVAYAIAHYNPIAYRDSISNTVSLPVSRDHSDALSLSVSIAVS